MTAGRKNHGQNQNWCTPPKIISAVRDFYEGRIDLDPCSNEHSVVDAVISYQLPMDGLSASWNYSRIYVNPPYGRDQDRRTSIYDWLKNCQKAHQEHGSEVIALVPVATNTKHWKEFVFGAANCVCFLADTRLRFLENGVVSMKGAPMACCLIYWGKNSERFQELFSSLGAVVEL